MWPWDELGLDGPADVRAVRRAYAARLKGQRPEEDQAAFTRLRAAYERALALARAREAAAAAEAKAEAAQDDAGQDGALRDGRDSRAGGGRQGRKPRGHKPGGRAARLREWAAPSARSAPWPCGGPAGGGRSPGACRRAARGCRTWPQPCAAAIR